MVGCHHQLNGHEFEQTPGVGDGRGGLACCSPWGGKESDMTEQYQFEQKILSDAIKNCYIEDILKQNLLFSLKNIYILNVLL